LDSHRSRFLIPHLANQDDIGCLAQHGADDSGKVQADAVPDFALIDTRQVVFHGIFGGDNLFIRAIQVIQCGIEGGRFS